MATTIGEAIRSINPSAKYTITHEKYDTTNPDLTIEWLDGTTPISKEDIKSEMDRQQAIEDNK